MLAQIFSCTDLVTDLEWFYNSILELLNNLEEKEEVVLFLLWWNRQIFPLYTKSEWLPSKNSVLLRICAKHVEYHMTSHTHFSNACGYKVLFFGIDIYIYLMLLMRDTI